MSQSESFARSSFGSRSRDLRRQRTPCTPVASPYSLAGPRLSHVESRRSNHRDPQSFVSQEYQDCNPNNGEEGNAPIWGLAGPLPRIRRPGMQPRTASFQRKEPPARPAVPRQSTHESAQPLPPSGTAPAPQVEVTPDKHSDEAQSVHPRPSGDIQSPSREPDLLRRATTAHWSSYHPEGLEQQGSLRPEDASSTRALRQRHNLVSENISAHDLAISPMVSVDSRRGRGGRDNLDIREYPTGSAVQNVARGKLQQSADGHDTGHIDRVRSESAIESARWRLQGLADTAENESDLRHYPANIDWEEYQPPEIQPSVSQHEKPSHPDFFNSWGPIRHKLRQPFAEFLGTLVFMIIGLSGSIVHMAARDDYGNLLTAYLAWGLGVMIAIYVAGGISGAHLNPTISIILSIFRGFPWHLCWQYILAQMLGAILASGIVYGIYQDAIRQFAASDIARAGPAFWTQPREGLSDVAAFFTEFVATGIATGSILAMGDDRNTPPGAGMHAFIIGLLVTALCMAFSYNTGTCLNPARDFGPRLITWAAGFGSNVFTLHNWWWIWGPWVGTLTGGITGASLYDILIFVGGESPVNYPRGRLRERFNGWKEIREKPIRQEDGGRNKEINDIA